MRAEKIIDRVKEFLLWIYVVAVVAATGHKTKRAKRLMSQ